MRTLVTGAAGFIGSFTVHRLLAAGDEVVGFDNLNDYYDPSLKQARLDRIMDRADSDRFHFVRGDLQDRDEVDRLFAANGIDRVVHLAAQAGVRHSLDHPHVYIESNVAGFLHILEGCRHHGIGHLVYASTSSVYGSDASMPFSEHRGGAHPMTLYAATKRANEHMAHAYSNLFGLPTTGLRFFTVYGPWGRPDMALFLFTKAMLAGESIRVFNNGNHRRDFTFVEDIVTGITGILDQPAAGDPGFDPHQPDPARSAAPYRIYNIGGGRPIELMRYIELIEARLGVTATKELLPLQPGDIPETSADTTDLRDAIDYTPQTSIEDGVTAFVDWYLEYYGDPRTR